MNIMIGTLLIATVVLATPSCARIDHHQADDICGSTDASHVCTVPFEAIYSHREVLANRNVRLEGVLVVGIRPEPPGSEIPVMLLFSSMERARICNPELAIELVTASAEIANELKNASGGFVSVTGRLQPSAKGHWGQMEITVPPALVNSEKGNFQCMTTPPPPPPEP